MWHYLLLVAAAVAAVAGHGRVLSPPGRSSAWRYNFGTPENYDDDGLNCGGFSHQHNLNGGRCGICGDPWDMETPRDNELGGKYGLGIIVANYQPGETITVLVEITAHHRGYWEFKLCTDPTRNDQECFEENLLELKDGGTKYYPDSALSKFEVDYQLPAGLTCEHCVLQWRYTAGNNWGSCANGTQGLGCGNQEQFSACSDISIGGTAGDPLTSVEVSEPNNSIDVPESYEQIPYACLQYLKGYLLSNPGLIQMCKNYVRGKNNHHQQLQHKPSQHQSPQYQPQYSQPQYKQPQYQQSQYNPPKYPQTQQNQPQYPQSQYNRPQYPQTQQNQPQYPQSHYNQPQYPQSHYNQPQYPQSQYNQPQYSQPQYNQPPYQKPQYPQLQYNEPQYPQPQYNQPQYQQPQQYTTPTAVYSGYNNYNSLVPKIIDAYEEKNKMRIQTLKKKLHKRKEQMMAEQKWR